MDRAGIVSRALFLWVQPVIRGGFKKALQANDAVELPQRLAPAVIYERFKVLWEAEVASVQNKNGSPKRTPSLVRVLWRLLGRDVRMAMLLQTVVVALRLVTVFLVRRLVQIVGHGAEPTESILVAVALWASNLGVGLVTPIATFNLQLATFSLVICFAQAVLHKGIVLHPEASGSNRRGDLVTLALSDCSRLNEMSAILMQGASGPVLLISSIVSLAFLLGPLVLPALLVICGFLYLARRVGRLQGISFRHKVRLQGNRLSVLNEMLQSIRFTKYYTLEDHYESKMLQIRREEESWLCTMKMAMALNLPLAWLVPTLVFIVVLLLHIAVHGHLPDAADTFAVLAAARAMYYPFYFFGGFLGGVEMFVAAKGRLQSLLVLPEVHRMPIVTSSKESGASQLAISIQHQSFSWALQSAQLPTLRNITMELPRGELWAIVGEIGSGKSSILAAILGEIGVTGDAQGGLVSVLGASRSYVAQEPMVMNATVRENVTFGVQEVDEAAYRSALEVSALAPDLKLLPAGDATEIGEKGITLSGGQKARVALARAVFASRDGGIVLLDDPLAAVDAHVGRFLFERCVCDALHGTTRLLVTNQLQFLDHTEVSRVLVLSNGEIAEQGKYQELVGNENSLLAGMARALGDVRKNGQSTAESTEPSVTLKTQGDQNNGGSDEQSESTKKQGGEVETLTQKEHKNEGAVSLRTVLYFVRNMGSCSVSLLCFVGAWLIHFCEIILDMFLATWQDDLLEVSSSFYLYTWLAIVVLSVTMVTLVRILWVYSTLRASSRLHSNMLSRIMHCPTSFFDRTPSGRIMNRLGEDQAVVDWMAPLSLEVLALCLARAFDTLALSIFAKPVILAVAVPCSLLFGALREVHRRVTRETMRWWMLTKSPVFHVFEETMFGKSTIYAFGRESYFFSRFEKALQANMRWGFCKELANHWAQQRLELLASLVVLALALLLVLTPGHLSTSFAAVSIVFTLSIGESFYFATLFLVNVEGSFASVERVKEFTDELHQEPSWSLPSDSASEMQAWPQSDAELVFESVSVRYLAGMPRALSALSFHLAAGEKLGIVGRTGSGKSTVMGALFRLFPLEEGRVLLGGVDASQVGIGLLRRQITIGPRRNV
eukprot:TRINITY_DN2805_c0_g2_i1.p1 TRINITY_DN2805_c0_g2~~TRINITY_DN2805_c0_g2_i1.p1  ORF type:complete len:1130 (-),score=112.85 TRINITY_DN2805_c0_g2_i1:510-3863(-)